MVRAALLAALALVSLPSNPSFVVHRLATERADPQLVNAWGLAASATGPWWISDEARGSSTIYAGNGRRQALTVAVPGGPTGVAFNGGEGFVVRAGRAAAPARFIYACEDGRIRAWSPTVPHGWSKEAEVVVDASGTGAIFRGVALAGGRLYATDFHSARVVVFDSRWRRVRMPGAFVDRSLPAGYAPFGIAVLGGRVFVTYAGQAPVDGNDAPTGGHVDEFDLDGKLLAHVGTSKQFDEPWGVALAPAGFGRFGGDLLVANFGSGRILAYARHGAGWTSRGRLPVRVPGIWGIAFGTGGMSGPRTTLFFAAGPHRWHGSSEAGVGGLLGSIAPAR
ncbi:MAG TPA: TIGR03118 family protein [Gaiellaceae bacterium]|nr:TIGR03118 family protein [Gaiellaceae bacterium]